MTDFELNLERISRDIQRKIDDMAQPGMWQRYTKNMECGEYREFKQYYNDLETILDGLKVAIAALREQDATDTNVGRKGCAYCSDDYGLRQSLYFNKSPFHDSMDEDVYVSGDAIVVDIGCHSYGTAAIKFCPMCGRRLEDT